MINDVRIFPPPNLNIWRQIFIIRSFTLSRDTLNKIVLKEESLQQAKDKGDVKVTGDASKLDLLLNSLAKFEFWFNIVTP
ncbi:TPA: hypothetical protein MFG61_005532 [Klebsiella pneumoniae]|nr:hypothetical protein [Klebsiella pneumoniae]